MIINCEVNTKANPILAQKYVFKAFNNREEKEEDQAYVMVKHLTPKTLQKYLKISQNGETSIDSSEMFLGQVKEVVNVHNSVIDRDMTKEEIIFSPVNTMTMTLISEVAAFLVGETKLKEEEEKN